MSDGPKLSDLERRLAGLRRQIALGFADRARELREAAERLASGDAPARGDIRRLAHRLRGIAGSAGHPELSERAARLEAAASGASELALVEGARRLAAAADRASSEPPASAPTSTPDVPLSDSTALGLRVVALDDEPTTRRLLEITLIQIGRCDAEVVADPSIVMERVRRDAVDLVIVDAMMPDVSGLELYRAVRREAGPRLPVVILSAASAEELGWELPSDARLIWLRKPFRPAALVAQLRAFVDGR